MKLASSRCTSGFSLDLRSVMSLRRTESFRMDSSAKGISKAWIELADALKPLLTV